MNLREKFNLFRNILNEIFSLKKLDVLSAFITKKTSWDFILNFTNYTCKAVALQIIIFLHLSTSMKFIFFFK